MVRKALELLSKNENQHLRASSIRTPAERSTEPRNLRGLWLTSTDIAKPNYLAMMGQSYGRAGFTLANG